VLEYTGTFGETIVAEVVKHDEDEDWAVVETYFEYLGSTVRCFLWAVGDACEDDFDLVQPVLLAATGLAVFT